MTPNYWSVPNGCSGGWQYPPPAPISSVTVIRLACDKAPFRSAPHPYSGSGFPFVSGAKNSTNKPTTKISEIVPAALLNEPKYITR